jgi:spore maturation protein CgeB
VDAWGGGDCNARFWEIVANKSCIIYQKHNIIIPYPYKDLFNCIEFKTVKEFEEKIVYVLNNKKLLEEITNNCYEHSMKYHTSYHRAKYMLEKMGLNS